MEILYTEPEATFSHILKELADIFQVPISTLSLIDREHQFFKSGFGLPADLMQSRQTARAQSICGHVVGNNEMLIVNDVAADPRFADNPLILATGVPVLRGGDSHPGGRCRGFVVHHRHEAADGTTREGGCCN